MRLLTCVLFVVLAARASGQNRSIGQWQSLYPYKPVSSAATDGKVLFAASGSGFFSYDAASGETVTHSKVDGMADAGTDRIGYDPATKTVVIAYTNGTIDLYQNGSFYSIPDLRIKSASVSKRVTDIYTTDGRAYLSTGLGILVINLTRDEVAESYEFTQSGKTIGATSLRLFEDYFYASTLQGLYRARVNSKTLQAFSTWQQVGTPDSLTSLTVVDGRLWASSASGVYRLRQDASGLDTVYKSRSVLHVDATADKLLVSEFYTGFGRVKIFRTDGVLVDSFRAGMPMNALALADGSIWCADNFEGLTRQQGQGFARIIPAGPADNNCYDLRAVDGTVHIAHGAYSDKFFPRGFTSGLSTLRGGTKWENIGDGSIQDVVTVLPEADGSVYFGSMYSGLYRAKPGDTLSIVNRGVLEPAGFDPNRFGVVSVIRDLDGNLVVGQFQAVAHEIALRTPAGTWTAYAADESGTAGGAPHTAAGLLVDDYNQKWWFQPQGGGVFVYDDAHTPEILSDDRNLHLSTGAGTGGLPSAFVLSMVKDRDGAIWVGTDNGIGIFNCAGSILQTPCDAEKPTVQYDAFAGKLFANERVNTMAVDGANRKWVGTNNGVWLLSPDAQKIVERFTKDNSPLPANLVQKITVDAASGDVYIGTNQGLMVYRGTATEGATAAGDLKTFPNPVPSGYSGTIAIKGLTTDADVRITDISGQLVYRTTALGGQAIWNGLDYTGKRPQSGVYIVLATNKDGSETAQGKLVFLE